MSGVGSALVFVFVGKEFDVLIFIGFGVLYPVSSILWVAVPVGES